MKEKRRGEKKGMWFVVAAVFVAVVVVAVTVVAVVGLEKKREGQSYCYCKA